MYIMDNILVYGCLLFQFMDVQVIFVICIYLHMDSLNSIHVYTISIYGFVLILFMDVHYFFNFMDLLKTFHYFFFFFFYILTFISKIYVQFLFLVS